MSMRDGGCGRKDYGGYGPTTRAEIAWNVISNRIDGAFGSTATRGGKSLSGSPLRCRKARFGRTEN